AMLLRPDGISSFFRFLKGLDANPWEVDLIDVSCFRERDQVDVLTRSLCGFDLLLHVVHHRYGSDQNDGGNDLVQMQAGMEEAPGDANSGECLHHLKIARCGCAREMQPLKIDRSGQPMTLLIWE